MNEKTELIMEKAEQYCKLPIPITAYQTDKEFDIETLEGIHHASIGDWIITGVKGEQYPCKPDIFEKTYIKYGQANKMEQVAAMFGKRLGEEFTVKYQTPKYKYVTQHHVTFEEKGLTVYEQNKDIILRQLLTGQAVIVNE